MIDTVQQHIVSLEKRVGHDAKSPLFAQLAEYYLEASRAEEALRICDAGLAHFPFYTTGHLMKGKALAALNMKAEARREFEFVLDFLPQNKTIIQLLAETPLSPEETLAAPSPASARKILAPEPVYKEPAAESPPPSGVDVTFPTTSAPEVAPSPEPTFGFGGFESTAPGQPPELPPTTAPSQNFFEALTQAPPPTPTEGTFNFGMNAPPVEEQDTFNTSPFSEFNFPQPEPLINANAQTPSTDLFGGFEFTPPTADITLPFTSAPKQEEPFEQYASRRVKELTGRDTVSIEEYLTSNPSAGTQELTLPGIGAPSADAQGFTMPGTGFPSAGTQEFALPGTGLPSVGPPEFTLPDTGFSPPGSQEFTLPDTGLPSPGPQEFSLPGSFSQTTGSQDSQPPIIDLPFTGEQNKIEELTNKLQNAGKITPVINFAQKETPTASEQDTPAGMGFVTPTLAEIYAKQGWFDDAIKAYKTLARNKPADKERYEKRISELAQSANALVVPELNLGQIKYEVERCAAGNAKTILVPHAGGSVHRPEVILDAIVEGAK